jgi:hypothetical protein
VYTLEFLSVDGNLSRLSDLSHLRLNPGAESSQAGSALRLDGSWKAMDDAPGPPPLGPELAT